MSRLPDDEVCPHAVVENGVCKKCGLCRHEVLLNGRCSRCGTCTHFVIVNGICNACGQRPFYGAGDFG